MNLSVEHIILSWSKSKLIVKYMTIFTFGDSHSVHPFDKLPYISANSIGSTLAFRIGRDRLVRLDILKFPVAEGDTVIFSFGEIDCRCHIHKYINDTNTYQYVIKNIVDSYFEGIKEIVAPFTKLSTYIYNVVPPIEFDATIWNNPEYPFLGTNEDRKKYHLFFNECIAKNCRSYGYGFFDIYDKYTDSNGFLRKSDSDGFIHIMNPQYHNEFMISQGIYDITLRKKATLGEIHPDTIAGKVLMGLVQHDLSVTIILETGCKNGLDATLCCVLGAVTRPEYMPVKILALDISKLHIALSLENWKERPGSDMIEFYNAHISKSMIDEEIKDESNIKKFNDAATLTIRKNIDLLILNGEKYCEFSDYQEARKLNPKYIFIDNTVKSNRVLEHAQQNGFSLVFENAERHGVALLKRNG